MEWKLKSNGWAWIGWILLLVLTMLLITLLLGEFNLLNINWITAKNMRSVGFFYPIKKENFNTTYLEWVNQQPIIYKDYFLSIIDSKNVLQFYNANGQLSIDGNIATSPVSFTFPYPFSYVNINSLWVVFIVLFFNLICLIIYHFICLKFQKKWYLTTEVYPFLFSFWIGWTTLYFSGALPGFNLESNYAWYIIIIRGILIIVAGFLGFYIPFQIHRRYAMVYKNWNYYQAIKSIVEENKEFEKTKIKLKKQKTYFEVKKDIKK